MALALVLSRQAFHHLMRSGRPGPVSGFITDAQLRNEFDPDGEPSTNLLPAGRRSALVKCGPGRTSALLPEAGNHADGCIRYNSLLN